MRYELDTNNYISNVFFGCNSGTCTEYTGTVPEGYSSLVEWADKANIRAYKIVDGNLTYDEARDTELQAEFAAEGIGDIRITSTNVAPNEPGTWTLIDQEFTPTYGTNNSGSTYFTKNSVVSSFELSWIRSGHILTMRIGINYNPNSYGDNAQTLGTIHWNAFGIKNLAYSITNHLVGSDAGNGAVTWSINYSSGLVEHTDILDSPATTAQSWYLQVEFHIPSSLMLESACNKFYWKRTA